MKQSITARQVLIYLSVAVASLLAACWLTGCVTQKGANDYMVKHPYVAKVNALHYIDDNKAFGDSLKADALQSTPCPSQPPVAIGSVDTSKLMAYLMAIGCPIDSNGEDDYKPNVLKPSIKQDLSRIIDSLRSHLHADTVMIPPDPRIMAALNIKLGNAEDSINTLKLDIATLNGVITARELDKKTAEDKASGWEWKFWGLVIALTVLIVGRICWTIYESKL